MQGIYYPIAQHLQQFCKENEFVIWRSPFRWKRHIPNQPPPEDCYDPVDSVLANHYDGMELEYLAEEFGYEINWEYNLRHVAIVRKK